MAHFSGFFALALCIFLSLPIVSPSVVSPTKLYGSGATNVQNIFGTLIPQVNKAHKAAITYKANGATNGLLEFVNSTNQFCIVDKPMPSLVEVSLRGGVKLTLPYLLQTISVYVYLPSNYETIFLTSSLLAQIYQGNITYWADARITKLNPTLKIAPTEQIHVVHRSDSAGTTDLFTEYLSLSSPGIWKLGTGSLVPFPKLPNFFGALGSTGVGAAMRATPFSIGYLVSGIGRALSLNEVHLQNAAGVFLTPKTANLYSSIPISYPRAEVSWAGISLVNAQGAKAWPMTSFVYVLARKDASELGATGGLLSRFLHYLMSGGGQRTAKKYGFAKIPTALATQNVVAIRKMILDKGVNSVW